MSDVDRIFPPGPGKDLIIRYCQNCHSLAPVVVGSATGTEASLTYTRGLHLTGFAAVDGLTEGEADIIFAYLVDSFVGKPLPDIPEDWIAAWTYY